MRSFMSFKLLGKYKLPLKLIKAINELKQGIQITFMSSKQ